MKRIKTCSLFQEKAARMHVWVRVCSRTCMYLGKKMRIIEENMDFEQREHEKEGILITN